MFQLLSEYPSYYLGAYGLTGLTAYFALLEVCKPKKNEVVFVNSAAGAVGHIVAQISKIQGFMDLCILDLLLRQAKSKSMKFFAPIISWVLENLPADLFSKLLYILPINVFEI